jgi:esterase/lipase
MKSWLPLDPQKMVANLRCPVLILQGTKDLQIKEIDAQNLHKANITSKLVVINNMNHVMKMVTSDERSENVKAYSDPQLPVSQELVKAIANFILTTR